jgi:hypothetical protein
MANLSDKILPATITSSVTLANSAVQPGDSAITLANSAVQPNDSPTLDVITANSYTDTVFAITGTTPALDPANGGIQTWTLSAASSPTDSFSAGESMTLMVNDGTDYAITWPTMQWSGGDAPTLATTGYSVIVLWKVGATLYGASVGDMS